ncbi:MAG: ABC transporter ATP-binding protein [Myxococcota bacterium]
MTTSHENSTGTWWRRVLAQVRPYGFHLAGILALGLLSTPLTLLTPLPLKIAVDGISGTHDDAVRSLLAWLPEELATSRDAVLILAVGLLILVAVLGQLHGLLVTLLRHHVGERLVLDLRTTLFRHVQRVSLSYHDKTGTADTTHRIQHDAPAIQHLTVDGIIPFITSTVTLVAMVWVTVRLDWQLALVALAVSPPIYLATRLERERLRQHSRETKRLESSAASVVQEVLGALRVVKAFGQEQREEERFRHRASAGLRARLKLAALEGRLGLTVGMLTATGSAVVLYLGVQHVTAGTLTLGELLLIMGYLTQLYDPIRAISRRTASLQSHLASLERAFSLLDQTPDVTERPDARPLVRAAGAISFRNVSFGYDEREVLHGISFQVPAGARVGIAGTTGGGKTTVLSLLMRFHDPRGGQVLLDGVDLRDYRLTDLRNQFATVLQDPVLFSTSIAENIAYARPNATYDEVVAAATAAHAHDFIQRLPEGYQTVVGERGIRLSGGERQRISLARAFLKNAPILILDEPTSAVDPATEATMMAIMERLMVDKTIFMVAHRLGTLEHCDIRLRLEHGRIVEFSDRTSGAQRSVS